MVTKEKGVNYGKHQFNINFDFIDYVHNKKQHPSKKISAVSIPKRIRQLRKLPPCVYIITHFVFFSRENHQTKGFKNQKPKY